MSEKMNNNKNGKFHKDITFFNIIFTIILLFANLIFVYVLINASKFSNLSKNKFILINIFSILILLSLNITFAFSIKKKKKIPYFISVILMFLIVFAGCYGSFILLKVNKNVKKITNETTTKSISTSLVIYDENGAVINDIKQLDGKTIGLANGTNEFNLAKEKVSSKGITVSYETYQDYSEEILALFNKEIDCAVLPSNYQDIFVNETGLQEYMKKTRIIYSFENEITIKNEVGENKDLTIEPFTVLLIGKADGLSDTMILMSVNPISMKVTMTSFARDSYVPISCYNGASSKLNAAIATSRECLINTIEDLIGINIDYYVETNFKGVVQIVDALDGIVVNNPVEFVGQTSDSKRGKYTVWVPAGNNVLLNGEQALAFARERHKFSTGDFARQQHQQEVIEAIMRKIMRTKDINTLLNIIGIAGDNIQTNLSVDQMTGFLSYVIQKTNRYYDQEMVEKVISIDGSRVTGYSDNLWNEGLQTALYIYRPWNGSLKDNQEAIERNINLNSTITPMESWKWSTNWVFEKPVISKETYNEKQIKSYIPPTIGNYIGRDIESLQSFCDSYGITLNITYIQNDTVINGTIIEQDIMPGTSVDTIDMINVSVASSDPTIPSESTYQNWCYSTYGEGHWYNNNCYENAEDIKELEEANQPENNNQSNQEINNEPQRITCGWNAHFDESLNSCVCNDGYEGDASTTCTVIQQSQTYTCWDGSIVNNPDNCPAQQTTITCWDGSIVNDTSQCPPQQTEQQITANKCPNGQSGTYPDCYIPYGKPSNCEGTFDNRTGICTCSNGNTYNSSTGCSA